jgi:hypothetical protein
VFCPDFNVVLFEVNVVLFEVNVVLFEVQCCPVRSQCCPVRSSMLSCSKSMLSCSKFIVVLFEVNVVLLVVNMLEHLCLHTYKTLNFIWQSCFRRGQHENLKRTTKYLSVSKKCQCPPRFVLFVLTQIEKQGKRKSNEISKIPLVNNI